MARPKRNKPYNPAAQIHDRQSKDLLRNAMVAVIDVDDPMGLEPGDQIRVLRSIRNDPLGSLHSRGHIGEDQYQAGRAFQSDFEAVERPAQAVDPSKPYVDCSRNPQPLSDSFSKALMRLNRAHGELGLIGSALAHDVLVTGLNYAQIAEARGLAGERWHKYFGMRFQECLDCLALCYGFAMKKR